jgi:hypothetical protein
MGFARSRGSYLIGWGEAGLVVEVGGTGKKH